MLLLPGLLFYVSPIVPGIAAKEGIISGSLVVFGVIFLTSLFVGRSYCGWLCGFGAIQDQCSKINKKSPKGEIFGWIKNILWLPWWFGIIAALLAVGGVKGVNFFYFTTKGLSATDPDVYFVLYTVYAVIILLSLLFGRRAFCRYLCTTANFNMLGNKLRHWLHLPGLRLKADPKACTSCKDCNDVCIKGLDVNAMVKADSVYHAECVLCGCCVDACKTKAIRFGL